MNANSHTTIRISLRWVALTAVLIFAIGVIGGLIGTSFSQPPLPPLENGQEQLVTTVQEVTISPSMAASGVVKNSQRTTVLLAENAGSDIAFAGLGVVLTNDGLVASTVNASSDELLAFDNEGRAIAVSKIGTDALFGVTYYELLESVVQPFEIENSDPSEGTTLLALSRSRDTLLPIVRQWTVSEYGLPGASQPIGRQRILLSNMDTPDAFDGSALLTDEGALAGILVNASGGVAMPASEIRASLNRATTGQRESNPFAQWGFLVHHDFEFSVDTNQYSYVPSISSVTPRSPAAISTLRAGDILTEINGNSVAWGTSIAQQISTTQPLTLAVIRDGETQEFVLNPSTSTEPK